MKYRSSPLTERNYEPDKSINILLMVMEKLRDPVSGCRWDIQQNHISLASYAIEEAYEVEQAAKEGNPLSLKEELGDLLFQVIFQSRIAEENKDFNFADVVKGITIKMIERHPHVFKQKNISLDPIELEGQWEKIKSKERQQKQTHKQNSSISILDDIPTTMPSLLRSEKLQKRVSNVGFDWPDPVGALEKIYEELDEVFQAAGKNILEPITNGKDKEKNQNQEHIHEEIGDLLFSCVNLSRKFSINPETALRDANYKFERRFRDLESLFHDRKEEIENISMENLNKAWDLVKLKEKQLRSSKQK